jgi:hypothetical protein
MLLVCLIRVTAVANMLYRGPILKCNKIGAVRMETRGERLDRNDPMGRRDHSVILTLGSSDHRPRMITACF